MGVTKERGFSGIDIDVILGNCTKPSRQINHHLVIDLRHKNI